MKTIQSSVGEGGVNSRDDVLLVQGLLNGKGVNAGSEDGICGPKTIAAIREFQSAFMTSPDGLIEPGHRTWAKLSAAEAAAAVSGQSQWGGDSSQWTQDKKLQSLNPSLRPKVEAVLAALENRSYKPKIFYGWRSVAVQQELYNQGNSKIKFSFHNAQKPDGTPYSYAADIIDSRYGWSDQAESSGFWQALGEEAKKQGLFWGGDWSSFRDWAHVQLVSNSELAQVKRDSGL